MPIQVVSIGLSVVFLDQLSKFLILRSLRGVITLPILPGIFHLTPLTNSGVAFGLFRDQGLFVTMGTTLLLMGLLWSTLKRSSQGGTPLGVGLGLLLGGAVGNMLDRVRLGGVVDFLDFRIWPVFNIADSCITIGAVLMAWHLVRQR